MHIGAAVIGAGVAGPIGGAIGGWIGSALGRPATELARKAGEKLGEELLDAGGDLLLEKIKGSPANLEGLYRESLRLSLAEIIRIRPDAFSSSASWFANWDLCLKSGMPLALPSLEPRELIAVNLDALFCMTLERLDAQGRDIRHGSVSINLVTRRLLEPLVQLLKLNLPLVLNETFAGLIVKPPYDEAWKQAMLKFEFVTVEILQDVNQDLKELLQKINEQSGDIGNLKERLNEIAVLMIEVKQWVVELAERHAVPARPPQDVFFQAIGDGVWNAWNGLFFAANEAKNGLSGMAFGAAELSWGALAATADHSMGMLAEVQRQITAMQGQNPVRTTDPL
jgi:hypothetical protein